MNDEATKDSDKIPHLALARVGTVLKRKWRLDEMLGWGGMAVVYAATHRNGQRVAIKVLHPDLSWSSEAKVRFLREGYLANTVDHKGVVSILDDDVTDEGSAFLVMELLEGETVNRRWKRKGRKLPLVETLSITDALLGILAAAHEKGIVHRDIKPENVFLTRSGEVKMLDFGIACLREARAGSTTTQAGVSMGTPAFMCPEQARGHWDEVDGRSDLWAVGGMMFTLLSGRFVHEARTPNERLLAAMTASARPLSSVLPELPADVARAVDRALSYAKGDRWATALAMQAALRSAYVSTLVSGGGDRASLPPPPRPSLTDGDTDVDSIPTVGSAPLVTVKTGQEGVELAKPEVRAFPRHASRLVPVGIGFGALGVALTLLLLWSRSSTDVTPAPEVPAAGTAVAASVPSTLLPAEPVAVVQVPEVDVAARQAAPVAAASTRPTAHHRPGTTHQSAATTAALRLDPHAAKPPEPARSSETAGEGLLDRRH